MSYEVGAETVGIIIRVNFNGAGQNAGETILTLKPDDHPATPFVIEMDTPPPKYFRLLQDALTAMWEIKPVEISSTPWTNLPKITDIRIL